MREPSSAVAAGANIETESRESSGIDEAYLGTME